MFKPVKALIFDMDGVLIDSEPLWRKAMIEGFNSIGIPFTEDDCRKTTGMRFKEVTQYWLSEFKKTDITVAEVEKLVLGHLLELIRTQGKAIDGAMELFQYCKNNHVKTGLATSSYHVLVDAVLNKLQLQNKFDAIVSAEKMVYGKPHPEVFLVCAQQLNVLPAECAVVEDSINGVVAAKAAQMQVFAVPDIDHKFLRQFAVADFQCDDMHGVLKHFKELVKA